MARSTTACDHLTGSGSSEPSTRVISSPPRMGTYKFPRNGDIRTIRLIGIERPRARARSRPIEPRRAANGVGAPDQAAGRTGRAGVSAWRSGQRAKNGDISPIRCDGQIGCRPRVTRGAREKPIDDINEVKRVERGRTSRVTCIPGRARGQRSGASERPAVLAGSGGSRRGPGREAADGDAICLRETPPVS